MVVVVEAAGTAGSGDSEGGRGPGQGWRARGSCDLNTRSPPGLGRRRGGGGAGPLQTPPPVAAGERGHTALEAGLRGSLPQEGRGVEMRDLKDGIGQESENEFIARVVLDRQQGEDQCRSHLGKPLTASCPGA